MYINIYKPREAKIWWILCKKFAYKPIYIYIYISNNIRIQCKLYIKHSTYPCYILHAYNNQTIQALYIFISKWCINIQAMQMKDPSCAMDRYMQMIVIWITISKT